MTRTVMRAASVGSGSALGTWLFGVGWPHPALIGASVAALVLGWAYWHPAVTATSPWPRVQDQLRGGGCTLVQDLAHQLERRGWRDARPDQDLQHRLHTLAVRKLYRLGVDSRDPRAAELLGPAVHAELTAETFNPDYHRVQQIVTAIENVDSDQEGTQ